VAKETRRIPLKQANIDFIKSTMVGVTQEANGTGRRAFANAGYISAGKTGTAQVIGLKGQKYNANAIDERHRDNALYTAFAPADTPRIAIALVVENAGFGAASAAPIARKALDYYLLGKRPAPPKPVDAPAGKKTVVAGAAQASGRAAAAVPAAAPLPRAPAAVSAAAPAVVSAAAPAALSAPATTKE
jgi:penicillin-binding protein 2